MELTEYSVNLWGSTYAVRADWSQAACAVEYLAADDEWAVSQYQVADYCHDGQDALLDHIRECIEYDALDDWGLKMAMKEARKAVFGS